MGHPCRGSTHRDNLGDYPRYTMQEAAEQLGGMKLPYAARRCKTDCLSCIGTGVKGSQTRMNATENLAAQVERAALHARDAQRAAAHAQAMAKCDADRATQFAKEAGEEARRVLVLLCESLGAAMPPTPPGAEAGKEKSDLDLSALANFDTPDARELFALLKQAQVVAERVDAARGNVLPAHITLQPGESRGTRHAESIREITLVLRGEIFGCAEIKRRE